MYKCLILPEARRRQAGVRKSPAMPASLPKDKIKCMKRIKTSSHVIILQVLYPPSSKIRPTFCKLAFSQLKVFVLFSTQRKNNISSDRSFMPYKFADRVIRHNSYPCLLFAIGHWCMATVGRPCKILGPCATLLWPDHSASEMLLLTWTGLYVNTFWSLFFFLFLIIFSLNNYIIVTLWVLFLMASTSLILIMYINIHCKLLFLYYVRVENRWNWIDLWTDRHSTIQSWGSRGVPCIMQIIWKYLHLCFDFFNTNFKQKLLCWKEFYPVIFP